MQNLWFVNNLQARVSTGFTGTQGFSIYDAIATLNYYTDQQYSGSIGSYLIGLANPDLKWQKKYDTNAGVDFTLFKNMVTGRFDWYTSTTKGLITSVTTPESMGFVSYIANLGESENKGYEAYLNVRVFNNTATKSYVNVFASVASNKNNLKKSANSLKSKNYMSY